MASYKAFVDDINQIALLSLFSSLSMVCVLYVYLPFKLFTLMLYLSLPIAVPHFIFLIHFVLLCQHAEHIERRSMGRA